MRTCNPATLGALAAGISPASPLALYGDYNAVALYPTGPVNFSELTYAGYLADQLTVLMDFRADGSGSPTPDEVYPRDWTSIGAFATWGGPKVWLSTEGSVSLEGVTGGSFNLLRSGWADNGLFTGASGGLWLALSIDVDHVNDDQYLWSINSTTDSDHYIALKRVSNKLQIIAGDSGGETIYQTVEVTGNWTADRLVTLSASGTQWLLWINEAPYELEEIQADGPAFGSWLDYYETTASVPLNRITLGRLRKGSVQSTELFRGRFVLAGASDAALTLDKARALYWAARLNRVVLQGSYVSTAFPDSGAASHDGTNDGCAGQGYRGWLFPFGFSRFYGSLDGAETGSVAVPGSGVYDGVIYTNLWIELAITYFNGALYISAIKDGNVPSPQFIGTYRIDPVTLTRTLVETNGIGVTTNQSKTRLFTLQANTNEHDTINSATIRAYDETGAQIGGAGEDRDISYGLGAFTAHLKNLSGSLLSFGRSAGTGAGSHYYALEFADDGDMSDDVLHSVLPKAGYNGRGRGVIEFDGVWWWFGSADNSNFFDVQTTPVNASTPFTDQSGQAEFATIRDSRLGGGSGAIYGAIAFRTGDGAGDRLYFAALNCTELAYVDDTGAWGTVALPAGQYVQRCSYWESPDNGKAYFVTCDEQTFNVANLKSGTPTFRLLSVSRGGVVVEESVLPAIGTMFPNIPACNYVHYALCFDSLQGNPSTVFVALSGMDTSTACDTYIHVSGGSEPLFGTGRSTLPDALWSDLLDSCDATYGNAQNDAWSVAMGFSVDEMAASTPVDRVLLDHREFSVRYRINSRVSSEIVFEHKDSSLEITADAQRIGWRTFGVVIIAYDGTDLRIYVNGDLAATHTGPLAFTVDGGAGEDETSVGAGAADYTQYLEGRIDHIAWFDYGITDSIAGTLFNRIAAGGDDAGWNRQLNGPVGGWTRLVRTDSGYDGSAFTVRRPAAATAAFEYATMSAGNPGAKQYIEVEVGGDPATTGRFGAIGLRQVLVDSGAEDDAKIAALLYYGDGTIEWDKAVVATGAAWGAGDRIGVAWDTTTGTAELFRNGVSQGAFTRNTLQRDVHLVGTFEPAVSGEISYTIKPRPQDWVHSAPAGYGPPQEVGVTVEMPCGVESQTFYEAVTAAAPVIWHRLDETPDLSGPDRFSANFTLADSGSNGIDATVFGGIVDAAAALVQGSQGGIDITGSACEGLRFSLLGSSPGSYTDGGDVTWALAFEATADMLVTPVANVTHTFFHEGDTTQAGNQGLFFSYNRTSGGDKRLLVTWFNGSWTSLVFPWTPVAGERYFVAVTYDASEGPHGEFEYWVNGASIGAAQAASSVTGTSENTAQWLAARAGSAASNYFDAPADNPMIFDRKLSASEISDLATRALS